jgi:hypothetical protein
LIPELVRRRPLECMRHHYAASQLVACSNIAVEILRHGG